MIAFSLFSVTNQFKFIVFLIFCLHDIFHENLGLWILHCFFLFFFFFFTFTKRIVVFCFKISHSFDWTDKQINVELLSMKQATRIELIAFNLWITRIDNHLDHDNVYWKFDVCFVYIIPLVEKQSVTKTISCQ